MIVVRVIIPFVSNISKVRYIVDIHVVPSLIASAISRAVMGFVASVNTDQIASRCLVFFMPSGQFVSIIISSYLLNCNRRITVFIFLITSTTNRMNTDVSETNPPGATLR